MCKYCGHDLRRVYALSDVDIEVMVTCATPMQLHSLTLRNRTFLGDGMCSTMLSCLGESLCKLDLRGCGISDTGLRAFASRFRYPANAELGSKDGQVP